MTITTNRITSATEYSAASHRLATMTIIADGGAVTVAAETNSVFVDIRTVADGTAEILEYGRMGVRIRLTPVAAAQVSIF